MAGTPKATSGGLYTVTFRATNAAGTTTQSFALNVGATPAITSGASTTATVGDELSFTVKTTGYPRPALSESRHPGGGPQLRRQRQRHGHALRGTRCRSGGTYAITISATNSVGTTTQAFALTVRQPPLITGAPTASAVHGTVSTFAFSATGYPVPTMAHAGTVAGLSWTAGGGALTLSGAPRQPGPTRSRSSPPTTAAKRYKP